MLPRVPYELPEERRRMTSPVCAWCIFVLFSFFKLLQFHRSPLTAMKNKMSNTALVVCPSINLLPLFFSFFKELERHIYTFKKWMNSTGGGGKKKGLFSLKTYCGKVRHVSASSFITLLVHIDNNLKGPVSLLMWRWDNFGKSVSRNFDST